MQVTMMVRYFDLNEDLRDGIHSRVETIENQFEDLSEAEIVVAREAYRQFHVSLKVSGPKEQFRATALDYELLRAVDKAVRRIQDRVDKARKRTTEKFGHHLPHQEVAERTETNV